MISQDSRRFKFVKWADQVVQIRHCARAINYFSRGENFRIITIYSQVLWYDLSWDRTVHRYFRTKPKCDVIQ